MAIHSESRDVITPYQSNLDYIQDELGLLNGVLRSCAVENHKTSPANPLDDFKGLVITEGEVAEILSRLDDAWNRSENCDVEKLGTACSEIQARRQITLDS